MQIPWTWIVLVLLILVVIFLKQRSQVSPDEAKRFLSEGAPVIDVRSQSEFASGHINGAVNLPLDTLTQKIGAVAPDKNAPVLLHCQSGTRSAMAASKLKGMGYTQVCNLGSLNRANSICQAAGK